MSIAMIWLLTILVSIGMDVSLTFQMLKDIASEGYKLDFKRMSEISNNVMGGEEAKKSTFAWFIPILNLYGAFMRKVQYEQQKSQLGNSLKVMNCLELMEDYELEAYKENPTVFNAMLIFKGDHPCQNVPCFTYMENGIENKIYHTIKDGKINIVRTKGPVSNLSEEEQVQIIKDNVAEMFRKSLEKILTAIENGETTIDIDIDISSKDENETKVEGEADLKRREKINELKEYREQLTNNDKTNTNNKEEKGNSKTKK